MHSKSTHFAVTPSLLARFFAKVNKDGPIPAHCPELGHCWEWTGYINPNGYGMFIVGSQTDGTRATRLAHRVSYHIANGPVPDGLNVCHRCDYRKCVNPAHFFTGTNADNRLDCQEKGRANGAIGERNQGAKLTRAQVEEIRRRREAGEMEKDLAAEFSVWPSTIGDIVHGRSWR
jgi:hypothetical protein